jgi:hypothetical protein
VRAHVCVRVRICGTFVTACVRVRACACIPEEAECRVNQFCGWCHSRQLCVDALNPELPVSGQRSCPEWPAEQVGLTVSHATRRSRWVDAQEGQLCR